MGAKKKIDTSGKKSFLILFFTILVLGLSLLYLKLSQPKDASAASPQRSIIPLNTYFAWNFNGSIDGFGVRSVCSSLKKGSSYLTVTNNIQSPDCIWGPSILYDVADLNPNTVFSDDYRIDVTYALFPASGAQPRDYNLVFEVTLPYTGDVRNSKYFYWTGPADGLFKTKTISMVPASPLTVERVVFGVVGSTNNRVPYGTRLLVDKIYITKLSDTLER